MTEINLVPVENEMQAIQTMAQNAVQSRFYKQYGDTSAVMSIMLSARELGISPMSALNGGLNIIQGKVEISARMMNALIRRAGGSIVTKECTKDICTLEGKRADTKDKEVVSFTMEEAKNAGLVKSGGGWSKYPTDMLYARALSRLARRLFPDIIGCCYVEGEIGGGSMQEASVEVVDQVDQVDDYVQSMNCEEKGSMKDYFHLIHEKFGVGYKEIFEKFKEKPDEFMEKFNKWREKDGA